MEWNGYPKPTLQAWAHAKTADILLPRAIAPVSPVSQSLSLLLIVGHRKLRASCVCPLELENKVNCD